MVRVDPSALITLLSRLISRARDLRPAMRRVARDLEQDAAAKFAAQPWAPLDPETLARRARAGISSRQVLTATGRLRRSLTGRSSDAVREPRPNGLVYGTDVPYAEHVAGRRDPLPDLDGRTDQRVAGFIEDHVFGGAR